MPNIKKAKKMGFASVYGSDAFPVGLGSLAPEALGFSIATIPAFLEHSSSIPSEFSAPETFLEKSFAPSSLEAAIVSSTAATLFSSASRGFAGPTIKLDHSRQGLGRFRWGFLHRQAMGHLFPVSFQGRQRWVLGWLPLHW
jgi:hypothetical protein